jgi:two-component system response regulator FixJ
MTAKGLVFLVEDDDDLRMNLEFMLKHLGYEVIDFGSAISFLQKARRCSPAVLVVDMRMPQMSGLDLHKALNLPLLDVPLSCSTMRPSIAVPRASFSQTASD